MMRLSCLLAVTSVLLSGPALAAETASSSVVVTAAFSSRTSLTISSDVLRFDVAAVGSPAVASVDFSAKARTVAGAQVVLSVEPLGDVEGGQGPAASGCELTFAGEGDGTLAGPIAPVGPTVAGRWTGSGLRNGRLVFSLRADASGDYTVPVRFVLTAP